MAGIQRKQRHTLLLVHEGYAEGCLLAHLRALYVSRAASVALSMKNARGRGGRHALDLALRIKRRTEYDEFAIMVDTDQDWDDAQRRRAAGHGVLVIESAPCLEAWLLRVNGHDVPASSGQIKGEFARRYGGEAHRPRIYERHFPREVLDLARARIEVLDKVLRVMRV